MHGSSARRVRVERGGRGVVGHVGLHALAAFADAVGVPAVVSAAVGVRGERAPLHDRGVVLTHAMLILAGGGEACSDIEQLRSESDLFGLVASDSTLYRTITGLSEGVLRDIGSAVAGVRTAMWDRLGLGDSDAPVVLDLDSTLVEIHSERKEQAEGTYAGGYGFHPLLCFADATGEALAAKLRPGNAAANDTADLLAVLDDAIAQLPEPIRRGHRCGDDAGLADRRVAVRADSAGGTYAFVAGCRARNVGFAVVARKTSRIESAIGTLAVDDQRWQPALRARGERAERSVVAELTDLVDLSAWPPGTRLIVRREHLHPGAQRSLYPHYDYRYWGHLTDAEGDPAVLDARMRAHAHVEDHIKRLKDSGLCRFPFTKIEHNRAWLALVCTAADLVRWFQLWCFVGALAKAAPKRLRWEIFHTAARVVRKARHVTLRIIDGHATTNDLHNAYHRIALLT